MLHTDNFDTSGSLISDSYPLNQDKIWIINAPQRCVDNITFNVFDLESSPSCTKDYFAVQTSRNQQDIYKYCHHLRGIEVRRRKVQLTLHSDRGIARRGIYANVCISNLPQDMTEDQPPCTCRERSSRSSAANDNVW